jgi:hypothetical protein
MESGKSRCEPSNTLQRNLHLVVNLPKTQGAAHNCVQRLESLEGSQRDGDYVVMYWRFCIVSQRISNKILQNFKIRYDFYKLEYICKVQDKESLETMSIFHYDLQYNRLINSMTI